MISGSTKEFIFAIISAFLPCSAFLISLFIRYINFSLNDDGDINNFSMGEATSLPLTAGVQMFIDGKINKNGVHTPESPIIDPKIFFDYFKKGAGDNFVLNTIITRRS